MSSILQCFTSFIYSKSSKIWLALCPSCLHMSKALPIKYLIQIIQIKMLIKFILQLSQSDPSQLDLLQMFEQKLGAQIVNQLIIEKQIGEMSAPQSPKMNRRSKQNTESQRSSLVYEPKQLPSSKKDPLQIQEIRITRKRSFSKKRSIEQQPTKINQNLNKFTIKTKEKINFIQANEDEQKEKAAKERERRRMLNSKLIELKSGIELSIISESKNQSKIETPQQNANKIRQKEISQSSNTKNTFQKWAITRSAPVKPSIQRSFSLNSICNHTLNPGLVSFRQDNSINIESNPISFKDCFPKRHNTISNSVKVFSQVSHQIFKKSRHDRSKDRNGVAKRIVLIQTLFASKGVKLCQNIQRDLRKDKLKQTSNLKVQQNLLLDIQDQ